MFAVNGIVFNHESPRRGDTLVTRKTTLAAARIKVGFSENLYLGNLDSVRDWGYAEEYVEAMWLMLQRQNLSDYVVAAIPAYTIREFLDFPFQHLDLDWHDFVRLDERYLRPTEVDALVGDASKAAAELGWQPRVVTLQFARIMAATDLALVEREVRARG